MGEITEQEEEQEVKKGEEEEELEFYRRQITKTSNGRSRLVLNPRNPAEFPLVITQLTEIEELHVCQTDITTVPNEITKLENLKVLKLKDNDLTSFPISVCALETLEELDLSLNSIKELPDLSKLKSLKSLDLGNNSLDGTVIDALGKLTNLEVLKVNSNLLNCVPDCIGRLLQLQEINLSHNNLTFAPEFLGKLHNLKTLDISYNRLKSFAVNLSHLVCLRNLNLADNMLTDLPETVCQLKSIWRLDVAKNRIKTIPPCITNLEELKELWLEQNQLDHFPDVICELGELHTIDLNGNNVRTVHENIHKLRKLRFLDLGSCGLDECPKSICSLVELRWLCLNENELSNLPNELTNLRNLKILYLDGNPMKRPPYTVCQRGVQAIFNYIKETQKQQVLHQKLIFTGSVAAGKTSLASSLVEGRPVLVDESERTVVLDRFLWIPEKDLNIQLYDFGGQKWYQIVHHFFLDKSAIIVLVINLATYHKGDYEKHVGSWLNVVQARAPGAMVKLVGTHFDECSGEANAIAKSILDKMTDEENVEKQCLQDAITSLESSNHAASQISKLRASLENRLILPQKMHVISSKTLHNFNALRIELLEEARAKGKVIPASWQGLLNTINHSDFKARKFLTLEDILHFKNQSSKDDASRVHTEPAPNQPSTTVTPSIKRVAERKLSDTYVCSPKTRLADILSFFHSIGELLWFEHNQAISEFVFHQQEHLIYLLKEIFSENIEENITKSEQEFLKEGLKGHQLEHAKRDLLQRGIMSRALLRGLWDRLELNLEMFAAMTQLLTQFDLCYPVVVGGADEVTSWRFPWFLKEDAPPDVNSGPQEGSHRFTLEFEFLLRCPPPMYEKVSVRLHKHVRDVGSISHWRCGMTAHIQNSQFVLQRAAGRELFSISVEGPEIGELWQLLLTLVEEIRDVMREWPGVSYKRWFVCPQCVQKGIIESAYRFSGDCIEQQCPEKEKYMTCEVEKGLVPIQLLYPMEVSTTVPTRELLLTITSRLRESNWKFLGRALGLTEPHLEQIEHKEKDLAEKCYQVMCKWKEVKGPLATTQVLKDALSSENVKREDLAERVAAFQHIQNLSHS